MRTAPPSARVVVVQKNLAHYRGPFFHALRDRLAADGIELRLVYGQATGAHAARDDTIDIDWAQKVENRVISVRGRELLWQPVLGQIRRGDLVVVEQAVKLLVNNALLASHAAGRIRLAFWGHGQNLDRLNRNRLGEAVKAIASRRVHWWFAYTKAGAALVQGLGFPAERVTVVQNAIDSTALREAKSRLDPSDLAKVRESLGLQGANTAIFCGGLYREKQLDVLVDAADAVRAAVPDFELLVLGAGPEAPVITQAAATRPWVHPVGPVFGTATAPYFGVAKLLLIPGWTGLSIVDSFVHETPLVTVGGPQPPEIEYLETGHNGVVLPAGTDSGGYAAEVVRLLTDEEARARLRAGCRVAASEYTVEQMAENFAAGVRAALRAWNK